MRPPTRAARGHYRSRVTWVRDMIDQWRSGTQQSQLVALTALLVGVLVSFVVSMLAYDWFPLSGFFLWLLAGTLLLRFGPLVVLALATSAAAITARLTVAESAGSRGAGLVILVLFVALVLYVSSRQRSGLPTPLSEALLADLRDRLNAQGRVPELPDGWSCETAMVAAHGVGYAGDFMVADLDEEEQLLDLVLVDVVGKGVKAAPSALLLAGAIGGMVGALRGPRLFEAANAFLLRQHSAETFATAVHVSVDLTSGEYTVLSAGHPPALRWHPGADGVGAWTVDSARGTALGILDDPGLEAAHGVLGPGHALLFYTDGVVEERGGDIDDGIRWLQETAARAFGRGAAGAARRIVHQVPRGDDDRAVLILSRTAR